MQDNALLLLPLVLITPDIARLPLDTVAEPTAKPCEVSYDKSASSVTPENVTAALLPPSV